MRQKRKSKVFIFTSVHPWNDVRIFYKQAISLSKEYSVEIHAPATFAHKTLRGINIYGLPIWTKKSDRIKTSWLLLKRILRSPADVFHFHDPELIILGLLIKLFGLGKVIYDIHENNNQLIRERLWIPSYLRVPLLVFNSFMERLAIACFDKIIIAEDSYMSFIHGQPEIIHNYPLPNSRSSKQEKSIDAIYLGGVMEERGIFELLAIAREVIKEYPMFKMKIIGPIAENIEGKIRQLTDRWNLQNSLTLTGRMDYESAMEELSHAKIGLVILHPIKNYTQSLPTKIFEYMSYGIPYLATNIPYWMRFFKGDQAGYFVNNEDIKYAASKIVELLNNHELRTNLGEKGKSLVKMKYGWSAEEKILLSLYQKLEY